MHGPQPLLFTVLDALDGSDGDADVTFLLTTNRVELLERALAERPGRVDLAVEVGLPDASARRRIFELYARGLPFSTEAVVAAADRADGVTGSFARELMRRAVLVAAEESRAPTDADLDDQLDSLLEDAETLTRSLLGSPPTPEENATGWVAYTSGGGPVSRREPRLRAFLRHRRFDSAEQIAGAERFRDVVVDSRLVAAFDVVLLSFRGEEDDVGCRRRRVGAQFAAHLDSGALRHHPVDHDHVGVELARTLEPGVTICFGHYGVALSRQFVGDKRPDGFIVVDDQYGCHQAPLSSLVTVRHYTPADTAPLWGLNFASIESRTDDYDPNRG